MRKWSRREALRLGLGGAAAALLAACGSKAQAGATKTSQVSGSAIPIQTPAETALRATEPIPTTTPVPTPQPTYPPFDYESDVTITPVGEFYAYTYHPQPPPTLPDYRLRIFGHVRNELELSLDELTSMPMIKEMRTLECISNPAGGKLIGNAVWRGVPMAHLLELAAALPRAIELKFECADGYHTSIPVELAQDPHSFLAYWMNGAPLPPKHGQPLRALWPGRYGQKQPKWITGIELISQPHLGHWEGQDWSNQAIIVPNSRIDYPNKQDVVQLPLTISGVAFANRSGVDKVEVSTDDGLTWAEADLTRGPSTLTWTEWCYQWNEAKPGSHVIRARVTDGEQRRQRRGSDRLLGGIKPDGTDFQHAVAVTVKR